MEQTLSDARKWFLKLTVFLYFSSVGILIPYLPLFFSARDFTSSQIGTLLALGPFVSTLIHFFWGVVSDRLQTVRQVVLFLFFMAGLTANLMFSCGSFSTMMAAVFIFYAFSFPAIPLLDSLTLGTVRETGESYGKYRLWGSLGFALAAIIAGSVFELIGIEYIRYFYTACIGASFLSCLLVMDTPPSGERVNLYQVRKILGRREVVLFLIIVAFLSMTNKANDAFIGLYMQHLGAGEKLVGWAWTIAPLSEIPVLFFSGYLFARFHPLFLLSLASIMFALRWILFSVVSTPEMLIPVQLLHSVTFGLFFVSAIAYMVRLVPHNLRTSGQGLLSSTLGGIGGIGGSLAGGFIFSNLGPGNLYLVLAVVSTCTFVAFTYRYKKVKEEVKSA